MKRTGSNASLVSATALMLSVDGVFAADPMILYGDGNCAYAAVPLSILLSLAAALAALRLIPEGRPAPLFIRLAVSLGMLVFPVRALLVFLRVLHTLVYDGVGYFSLLAFIVPAVLFIMLRGEEVSARTARCFSWVLLASAAASIASSASGFETYRLYPLLGGSVPRLLTAVLTGMPVFVPPLLCAGLFGKERAGSRTCIVSALIAAGVTACALLASGLCFPSEMLKDMTMPLYSAGALDPRQSFVLRLDKLFIMLWLGGTMISAAHAGAASVRLLKMGAPFAAERRRA